MSPLQVQKRLRLQKARRLMLNEDVDAASAGYRVGYRDDSHFNREYKSLCGVPLMRDVERLREAARVTAEVCTDEKQSPYAIYPLAGPTRIAA